ARAQTPARPSPPDRHPGDAPPTRRWCRVGTSEIDVTRRLARALEVERAKVGAAQEELPEIGGAAGEAPVLASRDDDDRLLAVSGDHLRSLVQGAAHQLAEA